LQSRCVQAWEVKQGWVGRTKQAGLPLRWFDGCVEVQALRRLYIIILIDILMSQCEASDSHEHYYAFSVPCGTPSNEPQRLHKTKAMCLSPERRVRYHTAWLLFPTHPRAFVVKAHTIHLRDKLRRDVVYLQPILQTFNPCLPL